MNVLNSNNKTQLNDFFLPYRTELKPVAAWKVEIKTKFMHALKNSLQE